MEAFFPTVGTHETDLRVTMPDGAYRSSRRKTYDPHDNGLGLKDLPLMIADRDVGGSPPLAITGKAHIALATASGLPLTNLNRDVELKADPPKYRFPARSFSPKNRVRGVTTPPWLTSSGPFGY